MSLISLTVSELKVSSDRQLVSWSYGGWTVTKSFRFPVQSCNVLHNCDGIAIVESMSESGRSNAVVLNADGSERFRLTPQIHASSAQGFGSMYYIADELTAILVCPGRDFAVIINEADGSWVRWYETR